MLKEEEGFPGLGRRSAFQPEGMEWAKAQQKEDRGYGGKKPRPGVWQPWVPVQLCLSLWPEQISKLNLYLPHLENGIKTLLTRDITRIIHNNPFSVWLSAFHRLSLSSSTISEALNLRVKQFLPQAFCCSILFLLTSEHHQCLKLCYFNWLLLCALSPWTNLSDHLWT